MNPLQTCKHELLAEVVTGGLLGSSNVLCAKIEKRRLLRGVFAQFCHLVDAAANILLLFSLTSPLCFVALSLLPCVFLLTFCEC
jgi:hypothetical protein